MRVIHVGDVLELLRERWNVSLNVDSSGYMCIIHSFRGYEPKPWLYESKTSGLEAALQALKAALETKQ